MKAQNWLNSEKQTWSCFVRLSFRAAFHLVNSWSRLSPLTASGDKISLIGSQRTVEVLQVLWARNKVDKFSKFRSLNGTWAADGESLSSDEREPYLPWLPPPSPHHCGFSLQSLKKKKNHFFPRNSSSSITTKKYLFFSTFVERF